MSQKLENYKNVLCLTLTNYRKPKNSKNYYDKNFQKSVSECTTFNLEADGQHHIGGGIALSVRLSW